MNPLKRCAFVALCLTALMSTACGVYFATARAWRNEETDLKQAAKGLEAIVVQTHNGSITISGEEEVEEIIVRVVKRAGGETDEDAAECMKAIKIESKVEGSTYRLAWKWDGEKKPGWQASVSFDVKLPNEMTVDATTHNGELTVSNMAADAKVLSHNGSVKVEDLAGDLKAVTHNGTLDMKEIAGDTDLETHNGKIQVQSVSSKIRAMTHNGSIGADLSGSEVVNGTLRTNNGSVTVTLGDDLSARLSARTDNGRVRAERPIDTTVVKKNRIEGRIGGGDGQLEVRTHNGSITLK